MIRIVWGLLLVVVGFLITYYHRKVFEMLGRNAFAEKYMGTGSSTLFYQLLGAGLALIGMSVMTGFFGKIAFAILSPLFGGFAK